MVEAVQSRLLRLHLSVQIEPDLVSLHFKPFRKVFFLRRREPSCKQLCSESQEKQNDQSEAQKETEQNRRGSSLCVLFSASASHAIRLPPLYAPAESRS